MVQIRELPVAREFSIDTQDAECDVEFFVWEAANEIEVQIAVYAAAPLTFLNLFRGELKAREVGPGMWMVTVHYATLNRQEAIGQDVEPPETPTTNGILGPQFTFDTTGGSVHVTQSRRTRSVNTAAGSTTTKEDGSIDAQAVGVLLDTARAIGVSADRVEGTDIVEPKFEWSWQQPIAELPLGYMMALFHLTGTVNYNGPFFGFDRGESLYLGASGTFTYADRWSITHRFAAKPNRRNVSFGNSAAGTGGLSVPFIAGWDYVWFEYATRPVNGRMLQVPVKAVVDIVYPSGDHGIIFGGPPALAARMPASVPLKNLSKEVQQIIGTPVPPFDGDPDI